MTDFFTRVARRAIGTAPAIQPVVVSRYAPAGLPITVGLGSDVDAELRSTESRANNVPVLAASATDNLPQPASELSPVQPEPVRPTLPGPEMQPPAAVLVSDQEDLTPLVHVTPASPFAEPMKGQIALTVESVREPPGTLSVNSDRPRTQISEVQAEQKFQGDGSETLTPQREPSLLVTPAMNPRTSNRSFPVSLTQGNESPFSVPDEPVDRSSPVIRVTIGRIDVRAVTPAAPPAPLQSSAPAAPKLSLDEFLRQHNGRRQ